MRSGKETLIFMKSQESKVVQIGHLRQNLLINTYTLLCKNLLAPLYYSLPSFGVFTNKPFKIEFL